MFKTKPETEMFIKKNKRGETGDLGFSIIKNNPAKFDLSELADFRYLHDKDFGGDIMEVWVHKDDYEFHFSELHGKDDLKEWNGTEDHKEFVKGIS